MIAKIAKIGGVTFAFVVVAGISAYLTLTLIIKSEDTVIVPELEGKDVVYALELLTELELNTKVKGSEYTTDIPKIMWFFRNRNRARKSKKAGMLKSSYPKAPKPYPCPI